MDYQKFVSDRMQNAIPLLVVVRGSHAYGTNIETSDVDYAGVFIQGIEDILSDKYVEQISDEKGDIVFYEIRRFLELLRNNNPNILEILFSPEDCIVFKNPVMDEIFSRRNEFLTKQCEKTIAGYAAQQIKKARGQNKMQNWEAEDMKRKTPLDFCFYHKNEKTISLTSFMGKNNQKMYGLSKVPHSRDLYAIYFDKTMKNGFRGICADDSNELRLTAIPEDCEDLFVGFVSYNKDGYTQHCKKYKSYQDWLQNRNLARFVEVKEHGQSIDGKNMLHCKRLVEVAKDLSEGKGFIVRRPNAKDLIAVRKGEVDLDTLITESEEKLAQMSENFKSCDLPETVDESLVTELLLKVRKSVYNM